MAAFRNGHYGTTLYGTHPYAATRPRANVPLRVTIGVRRTVAYPTSYTVGVARELSIQVRLEAIVDQSWRFPVKYEIGIKRTSAVPTQYTIGPRRSRQYPTNFQVGVTTDTGSGFGARIPLHVRVGVSSEPRQYPVAVEIATTRAYPRYGQSVFSALRFGEPLIRQAAKGDTRPARYRLRLYDASLKLLAQLDAAEVMIRREPNASPTAEIRAPYDDEQARFLGLAAVCSISRNGETLFTGRILSRDASSPMLHLQAIGHGDRLAREKTPVSWQGWNGMDLAEMARDVLRRFRFRRWTAQADWVQVHAAYQVDFATEPGSVMLARRPYKNGEQFYEHGYLVVRLDLGENADPTGRIARWVERAGEPVRITIQSRSANSPGALDQTPWGPEMTAVQAGEVAENETRGVALAQGGRWLDVRVNLYTEDTESYDETRYFYGLTPVLDALEVIWREPIGILAGDIPERTGWVIRGGEWSRVSLLKALREECQRGGWRFRVEHNTDAGKVFLHLKRSFGQNLAQDLVLRQGDNAEVIRLRDSDENYCNVLNAWGAGDGIERLYKQVKDDAAIARRGEEVEGDWETDTDDPAELEILARQELHRRLNAGPEYRVVYRPVPGSLIPAVEDTVLVADPRTGLVREAEITDERRTWGPQGEVIEYALGGDLGSAIERLIRAQAGTARGSLAQQPGEQVIVQTPQGVEVKGGVRSVEVMFRQPTSPHWVRAHVRLYREADGALVDVQSGQQTSFVFVGLHPLTRYYAEVQHEYQGGRRSIWIRSRTVTTQVINGDDVESDGTLLMGVLPSGGFGFGSQNARGDRSELTDGRLAFYRAGELRPFYYLRHVEFGVDPAGQRVEFRAPFDRPPRVLVAVADLQAYDPDVAGIQRWSVRAEDIDRHGFTPKAYLVNVNSPGSESTRWGFRAGWSGSRTLSSLDSGYPTPWTPEGMEVASMTFQLQGLSWPPTVYHDRSSRFEYWIDLREYGNTAWQNHFHGVYRAYGIRELPFVVRLVGLSGRYAWRIRVNYRSSHSDTDCEFRVLNWTWEGRVEISSEGLVQWIAIEDPLEGLNEPELTQ